MHSNISIEHGNHQLDQYINLDTCPAPVINLDTPVSEREKNQFC